jgi:hypothetical protein
MRNDLFVLAHLHSFVVARLALVIKAVLAALVSVEVIRSSGQKLFTEAALLRSLFHALTVTFI